MALPLLTGMRFPVFAGSGAVSITDSLENNTTDFRIVLEASAVVTPTVDLFIHTDTQPQMQVPRYTDKKIKDNTHYYSTPIPTATIETMIQAIKHVNSLPKPPAMVVDKARHFIMNTPFTVDKQAFEFLLTEPNLLYGIELSVNNTPELINNLDIQALDAKLEYIKRIFKPKQLWLKIPREMPLYRESILKVKNADALVLGHGILSSHPSIVNSLPTLQAGSSLINQTIGIWHYIKPQTIVPIILSGGFTAANQIRPLLNDGVAGIQITSAFKKNWMSIFPLYRQLKK